MDQKQPASPIVSATDMAVVRILFQEYADGREFDLCFQNFEQELAELPGRYAPPQGGIWLAWMEGMRLASRESTSTPSQSKMTPRTRPRNSGGEWGLQTYTKAS